MQLCFNLNMLYLAFCYHTSAAVFHLSHDLMHGHSFGDSMLYMGACVEDGPTYVVSLLSVMNLEI